ncbi:MAG: hypothetical protein IKR81_12440 [Victivallales bacterium]|nr:hypothetical protein [Victivallales bacterium]
MSTEENSIFEERNGIIGTVFHEVSLFFRYLRLRIVERLHSPLWRFIGGQPPLEGVQISEEDRALMLEVAPAEQMPIPSEPPPQPPKIARAKQASGRQKMTDDLMSRFGAKLNAREGRKQDAARRAALRKGGSDDPRQMTFDFTETENGGQAAPVLSDDERRDFADYLDDDEYTLPPITLFNIKDEVATANEDEIQAVKQKIQNCLDSFGIDAEVGEAVHGPRVTMYKVNVAMGVRVATLASFTQDFSRVLSVASLRVLTPVPGKTYAGLEIPNRVADPVLCGNLLNGRAWNQTRAQLPLTMGRSIDGQDMILDLARAPHLLVAGTTGSGKSVCLNTFIVSLITRFKPSELKLMLVDPKVVEMHIYNKLPHLLVPVINDVELVLIGLRWLVYEMERRYTMLAKVGVRNLEAFNSRKLPDEPVLDEEGNPIPAKLPFIVLVIDEMADIMLSGAKKDVELHLSRLAAKSRAVGIHAIVATQRPDVKVITGTIKANFPTRIAFKTASQIDSRTILDTMGAESLLGQGDMLFKPQTADGMQRIQGAMLSDKEVEEVVEFCAAQGTPPTSFESIRNPKTDPDTSQTEGEGGSDGGEGDLSSEDSVLVQALEVIMESRRPTISYLQRRLKIGYNKSASIIEELEAHGIIGPQQQGGKREIFPETLDEAKAMLKK